MEKFLKNYSEGKFPLYIWIFKCPNSMLLCKHVNLLPVQIFLLSPFDHSWLIVCFFFHLWRITHFTFFRVTSLCHLKCLQSNFSFTSPMCCLCSSFSFPTLFCSFLVPLPPYQLIFSLLDFFSLINYLHTKITLK